MSLSRSGSHSVLRSLPAIKQARSCPLFPPQACTRYDGSFHIDFESKHAFGDVLQQVMASNTDVKSSSLSVMLEFVPGKTTLETVDDTLARLGLPLIDLLFVPIDTVPDINSCLTDVRKLLDDGKISKFGVESSTAFTKPRLSVNDVVDEAVFAGVSESFAAVRAPLNVFNSRFAQPLKFGVPSAISMAKEHGLQVYADSALEGSVSPSRGPVCLLSRPMHEDVPLVTDLKNAFDTVFYLEKQYSSLSDSKGRLPHPKSLRWGHIIAAKQDQLMNYRVWHRTVRSRIIPSLHETLTSIRSIPEHEHWAHRYHDATTLLLERFSKAVDLATHYESKEVSFILEEHCDALRDLPSSEEKTVHLLLGCGIDVAFTPEQHLLLPATPAMELSQDAIDAAFRGVQQHHFYFLKQKLPEKNEISTPN